MNNQIQPDLCFVRSRAEPSEKDMVGGGIGFGWAGAAVGVTSRQAGHDARTPHREDATGMNQNEPNCTPPPPESFNVLIDDLQNEVDAVSKLGLFPPTDVEVLASTPITILVSRRASVRSNESDVSDALDFIADKLLLRQGTAQNILFRGVSRNRLGQIVTFGCDVTSTTEPIFASVYPKKALEYGELVMAFDSARLDKTYRKVPKSESPETLNLLRKEYPTVIEEDGNWLWFSRRPPGDGRTGTIYESYYTFFIPGDQHEALLMIFLVGNDRNALRAEFLQAQ